ncbi:unnamed protein product, partial [Coccothraustes coccothraustes]
CPMCSLPRDRESHTATRSGSPGLSCFKRTGKRCLCTSNISPNRDIIRLPLQQYQEQQIHKPL